MKNTLVWCRPYRQGSFARETSISPRTRNGERGGQEGQLPPPATELGGKHIILHPPPSRNLEGAPKKNCVENARNSITPNILLVETGQVRKSGPSAPKGAPSVQGPLQIGLSTPKLVLPLKYTAGGNRASQKNRGPSAPKRSPADSGALANWFAPHSKMPSAATGCDSSDFSNPTQFAAYIEW